MKTKIFLVFCLLLTVGCGRKPDVTGEFAGLNQYGSAVFSICKPDVKIEHNDKGELTSCKTSYVECTGRTIHITSSLEPLLKPHRGKQITLKQSDLWKGSKHYDVFVLEGNGEDPCAKAMADKKRWSNNTLKWDQNSGALTVVP